MGVENEVKLVKAESPLPSKMDTRTSTPILAYKSGVSHTVHGCSMLKAKYFS